MNAPEDTKALREMRSAVGSMRREVDAALEAMTSVRERLTAMAFGLDLAVRAEDERRQRAAAAELHREAHHA